MNTIRMFAFLTAVLITALLLRVVDYSFPVPQLTQAMAGTAANTQSTPD